MKRTNGKLLTIVVLAFLINSLFIMNGFSQPNARNEYEAYYLRSANYPSFGNLWTPAPFGDGESQGVTHDDDNWYFTWTFNNVGYLFKIPVDVPLDNNVLRNPRVAIVDMTQFPDLKLKGYWHWGDPDHYRDKTTGTDYIVVPITGPPPPASPIIAIFRENLSLVAYANLNQQQSTGWCAIHPQRGDLYTSEDFDYARGPKPCNPNRNCDDQSHHCPYPRVLLHYSIPWDTFPSSGYIGEIALMSLGSEEFLNEGGDKMELYNMQGGEFTDSGELLYIVCGSGCCDGNGAGQQYALDGLHVFDTQTWREVKRSFNHSPRYPNTNLPRYFDYYYPLGCGGGNCKDGGEAASWSPEGLTIWDLDNGRAPNITGQLHVLLFKFRATGDNREVFEHFGGRLYVDPGNGVDQILFPCVDPSLTDDDPLRGGLLRPFKTFGYAYNGYPAWDGAEIVLKAGSYSETGVFSTRVRITSQGGAAIVGKK